MPITLNGTTGITTPTYNGNTTAEYLVPVTAFKNRIINGAMGIWQRGTSGFTTSGNYAADRFIVTGNTSLSAVAQSSDVPSGFKYSLSVNGTGYPLCKQRIESVNCTDLASQSIAISFWLKQTSGAGSNSIFLQFFYANSTDGFGATTQIGSNAYFDGTTGWVKYSTTFTSISANAVNGLELVIGGNTSGAATFLITGVQLEVGSTATSFDYRPYGTELQLCQRYYFKWNSEGGSSTYLCGAFSYGTTQVYGVTKLPVTMRTTPTLTTSGTASHYGVFAGSTAITATGVPAIETAGVDMCNIGITSLASSTTNGFGGSIRALNASGYLGFSAEL